MYLFESVYLHGWLHGPVCECVKSKFRALITRRVPVKSK